MLIPTVITASNEQISDLKFKFISGNGNIKFENSKYGPLINISSNSSFEIYSEERISVDHIGDIDNEVLRLNMYNLTDDNYWVEKIEFNVYLSNHYNTTKNTLIIDFDEYCNDHHYSIEINEEIYSVWSTVNGNIEIVVS